MNQEPFEPDFDKIKFLLATVLVCALAGLPIAYFAGGVRGEGTLRLEMEQELSSMRIDHTNTLAEIREEISMLHLQQERIARSLPKKTESADLEVAALVPPNEENPEAPLTTMSMITEGQVNQLADGITYARVVEIVGREGNLTMEIEDAGGSTQVYEWIWVDVENVARKLSIRFVSDKLYTRNVE
jgi:hypothetical protein